MNYTLPCLLFFLLVFVCTCYPMGLIQIRFQILSTIKLIKQPESGTPVPEHDT